MWSNGAVPEPVDTQFGELSSDALPESFCKLRLRLVGLEVVDMYIEPSSLSICDAASELGVTLAKNISLLVLERFTIIIEFAGICQFNL